MYDVMEELQRARNAHREALREHCVETSEASKDALDVASRYLASAVAEYLER